jgi:hypothetical protein
MEPEENRVHLGSTGFTHPTNGEEITVLLSEVTGESWDGAVFFVDIITENKAERTSNTASKWFDTEELAKAEFSKRVAMLTACGYIRESFID